MSFLLPAIAEREVLTGFNADDHFGNNRECIFRQSRLARAGQSAAERKKAFDAERKAQFENELVNPELDDTWWNARRLAEQHGKKLIDPYLDRDVHEFFLQFDHEALSPLSKPIVRHQFADQLRDLPNGTLTPASLQISAGVDGLFRTLLADPRINRFAKKYTTVSSLCQRWGAEVSARPEPLLAEVKNLPPQPRAVTNLLRSGAYQPYMMEQVHAAAAQRKFTAVVMFSGGGGGCIGIKRAGGHILMANEFVPEARRTYRGNFRHTPIDPRDIREITASRDTMEEFLKAVGVEAGALDFITGSYPCSEWSSVGNGVSDQTLMRPYSDTQQSGIATLPFDFARLVGVLKPKTMMAENVPRMAWGYPEILKAVLHDFRFPSQAKEQEYFVNWKILRSEDYGTPQERHRLIVIGVRCDVALGRGINSDADVAGVFPEPTHLPITLRAALAGLHQTAADLAPWHHAAVGTRLGQLMSQFPTNSSKWLRPRDVGLIGRSSYSLVRSSWSRPSPTLTATGQQPNGLGGVFHPEEDRKFSIPELKRMFGLPEDYRLTGTLSQGVERMGRMLPPHLMHAVVDALYERVLKPYAERRP